MESQQRTRVLIVANRTASTFRLVEAVRRRAEAGPCEFALLIPDVTDRKQADWTMETAQRVLRPAAGGKVEGLVGGADPFESVKEAVGRERSTRSWSRRSPGACRSGCDATSSAASKGWACR